MRWHDVGNGLVPRAITAGTTLTVLAIAALALLVVLGYRLWARRLKSIESK